MEIIVNTFQIVAVQVVCENTNHSPASVGTSADRNRANNLKCTHYYQLFFANFNANNYFTTC